MIVKFEMDLPGGETLTEAELAEPGGKAAELMMGEDSPVGGLVFIDPETGESTAVGDVVGALIAAFCFDSIASLAEGRTISIRLFAYPEQVTLKPEGDEVVVSGDEIGSSRYAKRELLPALVACGERYAALLRKWHGDDPNWAGRLERIDSGAKAARALLPAGI